VIRLVANIFVVMTSLVLGLMINTAKNRFDGINRDLHTYATNLILLDRTLVTLGPPAKDVRSRLQTYVARVASPGGFTASDPVLSDQTSEALLNATGQALQTIEPADSQRLAVWNDARQEYRRIVELRWALVEQAEGSIPIPLVALVLSWLVLIFGSFGYGAPRNVTVVSSLLLAAVLIAAGLNIITELDAPYTGYLSVSQAPIERVLAELRR
jgi:hypothetical protein